MRKKLFFLALPLIALMLFKLWFSSTHGFKIKKISPPVSWSSSWQKSFSLLSEEEQKKIKTILDQPFTYLARGQQAYAFASRDGQYVVKFLRIPKYHAPFWTLLPYLPSRMEERGKKAAIEKERFWQSCQKSFHLAEKELKEASALIYSHLLPTYDLKTSLEVIDPLGVKHRLDLDAFSFVIQKRAILIGPYLEKLNKSGDKEGIERTLASFVQAVKERAHKKIRNKNRNCMKNLGVIEGKVIEFDVGELRENPLLGDPVFFSQELEKSSRQLKKWLQQHIPNEVSFLNRELEKGL